MFHLVPRADRMLIGAYNPPMLFVPDSCCQAFQYAVKHHYWYQMYIDDMPMWALVGVRV